MKLTTSCGHRFCGDCILKVWRMSRKIAAISCPICRQEVTFLRPCLSEEDRSTKTPEEVELRSRILAEARTYLQDIPEAGEEEAEETEIHDMMRRQERRLELLAEMHTHDITHDIMRRQEIRLELLAEMLRLVEIFTEYSE